MSTLRITTPNYVELWKYFVEKENFIEFPYVNEYNNEENWDDIEQNSSFIKTNKSFSDTQKVLRNLRNKAMVSLEEQGSIHYIYHSVLLNGQNPQILKMLFHLLLFLYP